MTGALAAERDGHPRAMRRCYATAVLLVATVLLFARLGHHALWDDEAHTALMAKSVLRTGDTVARVDDHNLLAYGHGVELRDLKQRYVPPLPAFLAAPSLAAFGETAWAARLPFALCGLATVALLLRWLFDADATRTTWLLMSLAILGNVSFFLFMRQSRYYAPATLFSVAIAYGYVRRSQLRGWIPLVTFASIGLMATNYLNYAAACASLAVDYLIWGRQRDPVTKREWLQLLGPQLLAGAMLGCLWNPLLLQVSPASENWLSDRAILFWWNLRDLDRCEFGATALLIVSALVPRQPWLRRAGVALLVYLVTTTLVSPQPVEHTDAAAVRYLVPIIPLCMFMQVAALSALPSRNILIVMLAVIAFSTNLLNGSMVREGPHSTLLRFARELAHPPADPYSKTADWINAHVGAGQTIRVVPGYMMYPLMFHAPAAVYGWQLTWPPAPQFRGLPEILFEGRMRPDFVIAFGPASRELAVDDLEPVAETTVLDIFWGDRYRPELIWRSFAAVTGYDPETEAVRIYRLAPKATR